MTNIKTMTNTSATGTAVPQPVDQDQIDRTLRAIRRRSFAVLSTVSNAGFPHAAGVSYAAVGSVLYVNTHRSSRKALNVVDNARVAVVIPVRRVPIGPPFNVQFQATAQVIDMDDPRISALLAAGELGDITSHGELEEPDGCFLQITPNGRIHTYGIGVSILAVAKDPLHHGPRHIDL